MEKNIISRIVHKHDIEANWLKATNFIPKKGEIIVYDRDDNVTDELLKGPYTYARFKIGDGATLVSDLPFIDASTLSGASLETTLNNSNIEIPTSHAVFTALEYKMDIVDENDAMELMSELDLIAPATADDGSIYTDENGVIYTLI